MRARIRYLAFLAFCVLLLIFAPKAMSFMMSLITKPWYAVQAYIAESSATIPTYLRSRADLNEEIRALESVIASQQGIAVTLENMARENAELRALVSVAPRERIAAGVIARPPYTPYDTLVIDQGSDSGVVAAAPVYAGSDMVIGFVRHAEAHHAYVTLVSSPGIESTVYVFGPNVFAQAIGQGGGITRISIPQGLTVSEGDLVVVPSVSGSLLGSIDTVVSVPTDPEQYAFVSLPKPLASTRLVSVGTRPLKPVDFPHALLQVTEAEQRFFTVPVPIEMQAATTTATTTDATSEEVQE
jgi:cell shape-determining protein MreC